MDKEMFVKAAFQMRNDGHTLQEIGNALGVTREYVRQVLSGTHYKEIIKKHGLKIDPINSKIGIYGFTKEMLLEMDKRAKNRATLKDLSKMTGMSEPVILSNLKRPVVKAAMEKLGIHHKKLFEMLKENAKLLTKDDVKKIFKMAKQMEQKEIAEAFNVSQSFISAILRGEQYAKESAALGLKPIKTGFDEDEVIEIFKYYNKGYTLEKLAEKYDASATGIALVLKGGTEKYQKIIDKNKLKMIEKIRNEHKRKLTEKDILEIFRLRKKGETYRNIAQKFNINNSTVTSILRGERYKEVIEKYKLK